MKRFSLLMIKARSDRYVKQVGEKVHCEIEAMMAKALSMPEFLL
jgi:hypothetical protein